MSRRRSIFLKVLWVLVVGILLWVGFFGKNIINTPPKPSLADKVEGAMVDTKGKYGIVIKDLKTGEIYQSNEDQVFEAGSLYKLWVMASVFQQIQNGKLSEDRVLSENISALNTTFSIASQEAELTKGTITLTVRDALNQMITISHNYAALLLTQEVKLSTVTNFLQTNGLTKSKVGINGNAPTTTPLDTALFYEKLYGGELANGQYTQKMIDLLKNQKLNDGLPKYLPNGVKVAHKTGDIGWFKHDAGIVYLPRPETTPKKGKKDKDDKGDYMIVVLSESSSPAGAQERIAQLSKAVFDYFIQ